MKRFRHVLLDADLEDGLDPRHIFDLALSLARRNQAKLTILDVVCDSDVIPEILPIRMLELCLRYRRKSLARLAKVAQEEGVDIETGLAVGKPFLEITRRMQNSRRAIYTWSTPGVWVELR